MPALIAATAGGWTYGGSILTFAFPMILFVAVGGALWVVYTMPHLVPGHRYHVSERAAAPGAKTLAGQDGQSAQPGTGGSGQVAAGGGPAGMR